MKLQLAVAAVMSLALVGCGSTVQQRGAGSQQGDGVTLGGPATSAPSAVEAPSGEGTGGSALVGSTGTSSSSGSTGITGSTAGGSTGDSLPGAGTTGAAAGGPRTPIVVGIPYFDAQAQNRLVGSFGAGLETADRKAIAQVLIDDLNKRGGILGHLVKPIFHLANSNGTRATEEESACQDFTQDHKVQVVFISEMNDESFLKCLASKGVAALDPTYARVSEPDFASFPGLLYPAGIALDRLALIKADQLTAHGFFTMKAPLKPKAGIVFYDESRFIKGANALKAALTAKGITVTDMSAIHYPQGAQDLSTTVSDSQSAELHFAADGVTHVLAVEDGIPEAVLAVSADKQGYRPKFSWDSGQSPANVASQVSAQEMQGSQLIGWFPADDLSDPKQMPAQTQQCFTFLAAHGQAVTTGNQRLTAISECENVRFLAAALSRSGGDFGVSGLLKGAYALHDFVPSATFEEALSPSRRDGAASIRNGTYDGSCSCFVYTTGRVDVR